MSKKRPGRPRGEPKKMIATRITLNAYDSIVREAKEKGKSVGAEIADRLERMAQ